MFIVIMVTNISALSANPYQLRSPQQVPQDVHANCSNNMAVIITNPSSSQTRLLPHLIPNSLRHIGRTNHVVVISSSRTRTCTFFTITLIVIVLVTFDVEVDNQKM